VWEDRTNTASSDVEGQENEAQVQVQVQLQLRVSKQCMAGGNYI
jgi:hypothetical protein